MTKHLPMPENVITEIVKLRNVFLTIVCQYSDSLSKQCIASKVQMDRKPYGS